LGGTNLYAGLEEAVRIANTLYSESKTRSKRIFLFSDGLTNVGITSHNRIFELAKSISSIAPINSFGIGSDFDKVLMTGISEYGKGEYFFISGSESMEKVVKIANKGFVGLLGSHATLKLNFNYGKIEKLYGYSLNSNEKIEINDIRFDDVLLIFLVADIPSSKESNLKIEIELDFISKETTLKIKKDIQLELTEDDKDLEKLNKEVDVFHKLQIQNEKSKLIEEKIDHDIHGALADAKNIEESSQDMLSDMDESEDSENYVSPEVQQAAKVFVYRSTQTSNNIKDTKDGKMEKEILKKTTFISKYFK